MPTDWVDVSVCFKEEVVVSKRGNMPKLKVSAASLVESARSRIEEIETADLIAMMDNSNVVIVDIRDIRERQRSGFIPGSFHAPRGMIEFWVDPDSPYFKDVFAQDKNSFSIAPPDGVLPLPQPHCRIWGLMQPT